MYTVAAGGNRLGAAEAGINVRLVLVRNFVLCALTAGFAGILEAVRTASMTPDPSGSNTILLEAVAAVIIGGTLMTGGSGTVVGALIGALFLGVLNDGLVIKGVSADYVDLYLGIAIIIAMTVNVYIRARASGLGPWLRRRSRASGSSRRRRPTTMCCASSTSPSASGRRSRCATSTCTCARARCSGLLGDNGAGKSTLIKILCGFQKQDSGTMWLQGRGLRAQERRRRPRSTGSTPSSRISR